VRLAIVAELVVAALAAWLLDAALSSWLVHPLRERASDLAARATEARDRAGAMRTLGELTAATEARLREKKALLDEAEPYLLAGVEDRLWVLELQQQMWQTYKDVQITVEPGSAGAPVPIRTAARDAAEPADVTRLARLLAMPAPRAAPASAKAHRLQAAFEVVGPYASVVTLLSDLEAQPRLYRVARLEAGFARPHGSLGDRMRARVTVAAVALTADRASPSPAGR
jgi:hypothetical protein